MAVPWEKGLMKSIQLIWSHSSNWTSWERAISILANGKIDVEPAYLLQFSTARVEESL